MTPAGVGYGVAAATSWGLSDFAGGLSSRRAAPLATIVLSQAVALGVALVVLGIVGERYPGSEPIGWAAVAGTAVFISLNCFFRALASGVMGLVAAVSGVVGAALPVVAGALTGDQLRATDLAGIVLALVAVVLVSRPANDAGISRENFVLSFIAGVGAGIFFIAMGRSTSGGGEIWWPLVTTRATVFVLALATTVVLGRVRPTIRSASWLIVLIGLADLAGNALFVLSNAEGALSVAAVVASQYPAATAILARVILHEHLAPIHILGIVLALVAIALIALP